MSKDFTFEIGVSTTHYEGKCNEWGNYNRCSLHHKSRELVAHRFASAGRHEHKGIPAVRKMSDDALLVGLERVKTEEFLQFGMEHCRVYRHGSNILAY